ncbi:ABC transporter ATP-binding protein, partial [Pseudomonas aeruginosa]
DVYKRQRLVLDEPTNDLDVETLELLEEVLLGFQGTVLMVSHDRAFLDNVVTSTLVFEGEGKVREFVGGYQDWLRQGGTPRLLGVSESKSGKAELNTALAPAAEPAPAVAAPSEAPAKKKLSYKLQRELEALPGQIDAVEAELAGVQETIAQQDFYLRPQDEQRETLARLDALQQELDALLERWAELED